MSENIKQKPCNAFALLLTMTVFLTGLGFNLLFSITECWSCNNKTISGGKYRFCLYCGNEL